MSHRLIHMVMPKDPASCARRICFTHEISAKTYIKHRGLEGMMKVEPVWFYDEFDDVLIHMIQIQREEAKAKLTPEEQRILGL